MKAATLILRSLGTLGEDLASALWDAGTAGLWEVSPREWRAAFGRTEEGLAEALAGRFPGLEARWEVAEEVDWAARYQASLNPIAAGRRFAILPSPGQPNPWPSRLALRLTPGMAFGTGEHFTTSSCLRLMERITPRPRNLLDVGCGSGILSIAARLMGIPRVAACDIDPEAVRVAAENALANGARMMLFVGGAECLTAKFDCVVANIQAEVLTELMPTLRSRVRPGGTLLLAGILCERCDPVMAAASANGFALKELRSDGRWTSARAVG